MKGKLSIILCGAVIGIASVFLVLMGNPANMGICNACFLRDIAGALGFHRAAVVQYIRPEISGLLLGAFAMALYKKEFRPKGGSSPFIRFILGFTVMIGALMFLGCPLRMTLRLAGGDLNAVVGTLGFAAGILVGIQFLSKGFNLGRSYKVSALEGSGISFVAVGLMVLLVAAPSLLLFSAEGPGAAHAPWVLSLGVGILVGSLCFQSRMCMVGGIRDIVLFRDFYLISGFIAIFAFALIGNLFAGKFMLGFTGQPIAHSDGLWNFLGMAVVGWGSVLLGGCPLRQLILSGSGNSDSSMAVLGMIAGAAFAHNFALASSPKGPTAHGQVAVILAFVVLTGISFFHLKEYHLAFTKSKAAAGEVR